MVASGELGRTLDEAEGRHSAARAAYDAQEWSRAFDLFEQESNLDTDDLERHAVAANMLGRMDDYYAIRERAYQLMLDVGDAAGAAEAALWIAGQRMTNGEVGPGSGWLARAARALDETDGDSAAGGFLRVVQAFGPAAAGDLDAAVEMTRTGTEVCRRHGRDDLVALALHQEGLFLIDAGRTDEGLARLDEAMVTLGAGAVSPMVTGIVYCGTITGCWSAYELRRAQEWTTAMSAWCEAQPQLGNFTAECKVRRAELKQLHGAWAAALDELTDVSPADVDAWAAGAAASVRGNLARLQGRFDDAAEHFNEAARLSFDPQPGLALLRLARGAVQASAAMVRRGLAEVTEVPRRVELLAAAVEILIAAGEPADAAAAGDELATLAETRRTPIVRALHADAQAVLHLAAGEPGRALPHARAALRQWVTMSAPYQEARAHARIAEACEALGDAESARHEAGLAATTFRSLGAAPDLARLHSDDVLTPRELEVLRLVASGATNRSIAGQLVLSERTVDRHVSNIFTKLGVASRASATAYAYERGLV